MQHYFKIKCLIVFLPVDASFLLRKRKSKIWFSHYTHRNQLFKYQNQDWFWGPLDLLAPHQNKLTQNTCPKVCKQTRHVSFDFKPLEELLNLLRAKSFSWSSHFFIWASWYSLTNSSPFIPIRYSFSSLLTTLPCNSYPERDNWWHAAT